MRVDIRGTLFLMGMSISGFVLANYIAPPSMTWPIGWKAVQTPLPPEAQGLQGGQLRAVHYENSRPDAVMEVVYAAGGSEQSLQAELKAAEDYADTLAKEAGATMVFGSPDNTRIGTLPAIATEGTLNKNGAVAREWIGVANGNHQFYTFVYSSSESGYEKYKPDMEAALKSFNVQFSGQADVAKMSGKYGLYLLVAMLGLVFVGQVSRKKPAIKPPPLPK